METTHKLKLKYTLTVYTQSSPPTFQQCTHRPHLHQHVIDALTTHAEHTVRKFFGACNAQKAALDACFKAEKESMRAANARAAKGSARHARRQAGQPVSVRETAKANAFSSRPKTYVRKLSPRDLPQPA